VIIAKAWTSVSAPLLKVVSAIAATGEPLRTMSHQPAEAERVSTALMQPGSSVASPARRPPRAAAAARG
jgi:hypothetical protein